MATVTTTDLIAWLREQLDSEEQAALEAPERHWRFAGVKSCEVYAPHDDGGSRTIAWCGNGHEDDYIHALHIARHDPARVLAELDAKRRILERAEQYGRWAANDDAPGFQALDEAGKLMVRYVALPYADRPGYLEEWRP